MLLLATERAAVTMRFTKGFFSGEGAEVVSVRQKFGKLPVQGIAVKFKPK
jgi:hypothetical protein